jgi:hypothetical protein
VVTTVAAPIDTRAKCDGDENEKLAHVNPRSLSPLWGLGADRSVTGITRSRVLAREPDEMREGRSPDRDDEPVGAFLPSF